MAIELRRYRIEDIPRIRELHVQALKSVPNLILREGPIDGDLIDIENDYISKNGEFLVLEEDGYIIGMGAFREKEYQIAEIRRMRIDPKHWRKGYGQLILSKLEHIAKEMGYQKLILDTTIHQIPAQRMYEKNGYKETGRVMHHGYECIIYEKAII